ncbi:MAG: VOC family protein [Gammaproteobacteria bacterium]
MRSFLAVLCLCIAGAGTSAYAAEDSLPLLPALTDPATGENIPGKIIWADYFTSDLDLARRFYGELFDWEWRWVVNEPGKRYGMFYADGLPMAGIAEKAATDANRAYGRWIYYISVEDVGATLAMLDEQGGSTLLDRRDYAERGSFAVVADADGVLFGVLNSSSGDPADYRAEPGEWIWFNLYTRNASESAGFYASLFNYDTHAPEAGGNESEVLDIFLARQNYSRAGVRQLSTGSESQPTWIGYIRVSDVNAMVARATDLGGEAIFKPDDSVVEGDLAVVSDPVGAPIGLLRWTFDEEAQEVE